MRIFGSQSVKHSRGKYQKRLQAILLALLFSALLLLAVFFSLLYYQKTEKSWLGGWQSYAWFERDSFNTRNFLMHTEIETLTTDPTILAATLTKQFWLSNDSSKTLFSSLPALQAWP